MPYGCSLDELFFCLKRKCPSECEELFERWWHVESGLLSIGLKIHVLGKPDAFMELIEELGGPKKVLGNNVYKRNDASFCFVLPPVGNAWAAIRLLECIGAYVRSPQFGNPAIQLQVCSPGRLDARRSAILAIMFYLGSDTLRRYTLNQFTTSVSCDDRYKRGRRLVLYDAGTLGGFEDGFDWWARTDNRRVIHSMLPFKDPERTDIMVGAGSPVDVQNINLIATLLVHAQFEKESGYWQEVGMCFEDDVHDLLKRHLLTGLLEAPWVHEGGFIDGTGDQAFFSAIQELTEYALEESERLKKQSRFTRMWSTLKPGILAEAHALLETYGLAVNSQAETPTDGGIT